MDTRTFLRLVRHAAEGDAGALHQLPGAAGRLLASCHEDLNTMPKKVNGKGRSVNKPAENRHNVPKKMWERWSEEGRQVFNGLFESMLGRSRKTGTASHKSTPYTHTSSAPVPAEHWEITCWNAAWMAACLVSGTKARDAARVAALIRATKALDLLGVALTDHGHRWTREERRAFESAHNALLKAG